MAVAVKMPQLGETVIEGTIARWLKSPGDSITRLDPLLEISTDKIDTEVPAPADGTLLEVLVAEGQTVRAGEVLAYIGAAGETIDAAPTSSQSASQAPARKPPEPASTPAHTAAARPPKPTGREFISPVVANMAREHSVDLDAVTGSGLGGRITKQDVLAHLHGQPATPPVPSTRTTESSAPVTSGELELGPDQEWEALSTMRRLIADHMVESKRTSPHVTSIFEVDMTAVVRHREAHKKAYDERGLHLTYTPYFVAAAAHALRAVPQLNARFHDQNGRRGIIHNRRIHIGIAVAVEGGLVVPVIRDADERNLAGLARAVRELATAAQHRRLDPDATQHGTFTITNHGTGGSLMGTPVINQPQGAILGVGAVTKRPVVRSATRSLLPSADDAIVIRPMCYLSLTFDHRLIDGATADAFLTHIKHVLEDWQDSDAMNREESHIN